MHIYIYIFLVIVVFQWILESIYICKYSEFWLLESAFAQMASVVKIDFLDTSFKLSRRLVFKMKVLEVQDWCWVLYTGIIPQIAIGLMLGTLVVRPLFVHSLNVLVVRSVRMGMHCSVFNVEFDLLCFIAVLFFKVRCQDMVFPSSHIKHVYHTKIANAPTLTHTQTCDTSGVFAFFVLLLLFLGFMRLVEDYFSSKE